jgi:putative nucleotidyltransferase with HDIG domain
VSQARAALRARVSDDDRARVGAELPPDLERLFWRMAPRDQVHALRVLRRLDGTDRLLRRAALLHDVGKASAPLGTMGRALVVLTSSLAAGRVLELIPALGPRVRRYRQHPQIGAEMLRAAGAEEALVEIVAEHQARAPRHPETLRLQAVDGRE